jgi:two-component system, OmpR family, phosphate regulon sensor histidine kinase PhoR
LRAQFVANVTHELKTPLTSIKGFAETLRYTDSDEDKEKFINIINDEAERLTRLINDILTLSKIESNEIVKIESIDVNEMLMEICYMMKKTAQIKNIELEMNLNCNPHITGNKDRFKQMIINLIDNAIKYSEVNSKITVASSIDNGGSIISISDKGVGISKEHLDRIFERFYRVDKARSRAEGGTGLGLAIVKHVLINFKGKIEVESIPSKGSIFTLKIPLESLK